ncbi:hypothetical protein [Sphingomonas oryzagri]
MSDSMIERLAQAIWEASGQPYRATDVVPSMKIKEGEPDWQRFIALARAILVVMREPTDHMVRAAASQDVMFSAEGNSYIGRIAIEYSSDRDKGADTLYRAMIDAALAEEISAAGLPNQEL